MDAISHKKIVFSLLFNHIASYGTKNINNNINACNDISICYSHIIKYTARGES